MWWWRCQHATPAKWWWAALPAPAPCSSSAIYGVSKTIVLRPTGLIVLIGIRGRGDLIRDFVRVERLSIQLLSFAAEHCQNIFHQVCCCGRLLPSSAAAPPPAALNEMKNEREMALQRCFSPAEPLTLGRPRTGVQHLVFHRTAFFHLAEPNIRFKKFWPNIW